MSRSAWRATSPGQPHLPSQARRADTTPAAGPPGPLAAPALAKGPSQARITGPGLAHAIVVTGSGEPGQLGRLSTLAEQTGLFTALFGTNASVPPQTPPRLRTAPPKASLGPRYTII